MTMISIITTLYSILQRLKCTMTEVNLIKRHVEDASDISTDS